MTDQSNDAGAASPEEPTADEMTVLKGRAKMMGIAFSNNIGLEALRAKVLAKQNEEEAAPEPEPAVTPEMGAAWVEGLIGAAPVAPAAPAVRMPTLREHLIKEEMRLVRLRITNLDPKKKELPGEIITVANEHLGTVRKYIPFGEVTDDGYHVPYCLYRMLEERKFLDIRTRRGSNGQPIVSQRWVREFSLEVLPPLTPEELRSLAASQAAAGLFADD
ncbi:hypothetical protein [Roseococcus sp.]|uniref:hypothetical protein n=1 Tax=Roseococcus sp. TaxID=2109646 RepID=UPI003BAB7C06